MIIWLASYPRSGNTFFRILLNQLYGIKTPTAYVGNDGTAFTVGKALVGHVAEEWTVEEMATKPETLIVKTHRRAVDTYPTIYLYRDGRDALVSYAHMKMAEGASFDETLRNLIVQSTSSTGTWGQNVCHWLSRDRGNTIYVPYHALIANPEQVVTETLQQLNITVSRAKDSVPVPTFETLQEVHAGFFRRGQVGSYRDEMSDELHELFWAQPENATAMAQLGFSR